MVRPICNTSTACNSVFALLVLAILLPESMRVRADDWPMRGQNVYRRSWIDESFGPHIWQSETDKVAKNAVAAEAKLEISEARKAKIRWTAGGFYGAMCDPVVSNGLLWIGTADPIGPDDHDSGVLACFDAKSGELLFQHISEKLGDADQDWPGTGNTSSPFIQGNRLWFCTTRLEVICLDIQPLIDRTGQPTVQWSVDFKDRFKIIPKDVHLGNRASRCSIVGCESLIFINTTHSASRDGTRADPDLPSFVCLNDKTGETVWTDKSPGSNIVRNQHCNPVILRAGDKTLVAIGQGDGWVRAFDASTGAVAWEFDLNSKAERAGFKKRPYGFIRKLTESPVFDGRYLYFVLGNDREFNIGDSRVFCIDPVGSGDISAEVEVDGNVVPNIKSGLVWEFTGQPNGTMKTSIAGLCVSRNFVFAADGDGTVYCLDRATGKMHWRHEMLDTIIGTPLVVGDTLYVADEDGDVEVMRASARYEHIATMNHWSSIESSLIYAGDTLFIVSRSNVFAIGK